MWKVRIFRYITSLNLWMTFLAYSDASLPRCLWVCSPCHQHRTIWTPWWPFCLTSWSCTRKRTFSLLLSNRWASQSSSRSQPSAYQLCSSSFLCPTSKLWVLSVNLCLVKQDSMVVFHSDQLLHCLSCRDAWGRFASLLIVASISAGTFWVSHPSRILRLALHD